MAKYLIILCIFAILALENNHIFNRLHAKSQPSRESDAIGHYLKQQQQHHNNSQQHLQQHHRRHKRSSSNHTNYFGNKGKDIIRQFQHFTRHFRHQFERKQEHEQLYNHEKPQEQQQQVILPSTMSPHLRSMPRIWQHLQTQNAEQESNERMYADGPNSDQSINEDEIPPNFLETNDSLENINEETYSLKDQAKVDVPTTGCPKCESSRNVEHVSEEELTRLRIEFVKEQILEKLRLKEKPNVSAISLPKPIYEGTTIEQEDEQVKNKELDDYYARTSKKFIFLERETVECKRLSPHPSMCFSFKIENADADGYDVNNAVLWIFKNKQNNLAKLNNSLLAQQTIVVSEVQERLNENYLPMVKTIAIQSVDVQDEWLKLDIEWPIKRWFGNRDLSHLIHISCESCEIDSMDEMISVDKDYRPFIMVDTQNRRRTTRQKRSINCTGGVTECCREKLYISFDEIGWGDWIIQPRGYDAYFCRGSCGSVASVTQSASQHSTFLQKVISNRRGNGKRPLELIPCCTAKQYSSLQLMFMDSNNTATQMTFPNMVVESCGCR